MKFDAIFFDFDGVLIDSEPVHWACWAEVLKRVDIVLTWEYYRDYCIGVDDREILKWMAESSTPPRDWQDLWALYPKKKQLFRARMQADPPFPAGLDEMLAGVNGNYRLAVVSSSSCSEIEPLLVTANLRHYFETIVGGESVQRHKPAPDPYLLAAERLGVKSPLVVEDSEPGVASGRAAGFEVLQVKSAAETPAQVRDRLANQS